MGVIADYLAVSVVIDHEFPIDTIAIMEGGSQAIYDAICTAAGV